MFRKKLFMAQIMMVLILVSTISHSDEISGESPFLFYENYLKIKERATCFEEITSHWSEGRLKAAMSLSEEEREELFQSLKGMQEKNVTLFREKTDGNSATIYVTGKISVKKFSGNGKIILKKENGVWKVDIEEWKLFIER